MYLIFYFDKILCRLPFSSPSTPTLAYVIKEIREERVREQRRRAYSPKQVYYFEKHTKESPGSKQLPGPHIRIKGLPRYLDWSITHLTFYNPKLTYQCMLIPFFNFIYIHINIIPTFIINPYTMQITLHIKVFFKS